MRVPSYRKHSTRDVGFVEFEGRRHYLPGAYESAESRRAYRRFIDALQAGDQPETGLLTVQHLVERYLDHAVEYYQRGSEYQVLLLATGPLLDVAADVPLGEFGPKWLRQVRDAMVARGWVRNSVNDHVHRVRRMFRWAVGQEMCGPEVLAALLAVDPLKKGRTEAAESEPVEPIADAWVAATLLTLTPTVATMIQVQRVGGMRPGEVCGLRAEYLDCTHDVWLYRPEHHKTAHLGKPRVIALPPSIQPLLRPYLEHGDPFVFSPRRAALERRELRRAARTTKLWPSHSKPPRLNQNLRDHYTTETYRRAVLHGIQSANKALRKADPKAATIPIWTPNQLRHAAADEAAALLGPVAAQRLLGHSHLQTTNIYLSQQIADLVQVASRLDQARRSAE